MNFGAQVSLDHGHIEACGDIHFSDGTNACHQTDRRLHRSDPQNVCPHIAIARDCGGFPICLMSSS
jgi:hypothetical protein